MQFLNPAETTKILRALERYHIVFSKIFEFGYVSFDKSVPRACLRFNKETGKPFQYVFNPDFWESIDFDTKLFIIKHETAHSFLNHCPRGKQILASGGKIETLNIAMDLAVNHMLVDCFGVDRDNVKDADSYCWVDTVFPDDKIPDDLHFESYYALLLKKEKDKNDDKEEQDKGDGDNKGDQESSKDDKGSSQGSDGEPDESDEKKDGEGQDDSSDDSKGSSKPQIVDSHEFLDEQAQEAFEKVLERVKKQLNVDELKDFNDKLQQHGDGPSGIQFEIELPKLKPNLKWLNLVTKFKYKHNELHYKIKPQFVFKNRRMNMLPKTNLMPQEYEVREISEKKTIIDVWCFLDVSSSCALFKEHFLLAAKTFPEEYFRLRVFVYDTHVSEIDLNQTIFRCGGGTYFHIIEDKIQYICKTESCNYPSMVVVVTDGEGTKVNPQYPERWHWLLTDKAAYKKKGLTYIPVKSRIFELKEFFDIPTVQKQLRKKF